MQGTTDFALVNFGFVQALDAASRGSSRVSLSSYCNGLVSGAEVMFTPGNGRELSENSHLYGI
jgi:hypothetical protein